MVFDLIFIISYNALLIYSQKINEQAITTQFIK